MSSIKVVCNSVTTGGVPSAGGRLQFIATEVGGVFRSTLGEEVVDLGHTDGPGLLAALWV